MFDLRSLRSFVVIADLGSFSRASEVLNLTQPTVSAQIRGLEADLGAELLDRSRRPVRLTSAGEVLLARARGLLEDAQTARDAVGAVAGGRLGRVRLGTYPSATAGVVPALLHAFAASHPAVAVELVEQAGAGMSELALEGGVDLFLRQATPALPPDEFDSLPLWDEPLLVILPPGYFLPDTGPCQMQEQDRRDPPGTTGWRGPALLPSALAGQPLVITDPGRGDGPGQHPFWLSLPEPPHIAMRLSQPQSVIEMVRSGFGLGLLTELGLRSVNSKGLEIRAIDHPAARREVRLWWLRHRRLPAPATAMRDLLAGPFILPPGLRDLRQARAGRSGHADGPRSES